MLTGRRIRKEKRRKTEKRSAGNQIILHEEETEITEIDETSLADKRTDLSQGCPNLSMSRLSRKCESLLRRQGNVNVNMRLPSYDSVVNKSQSDCCEMIEPIEETAC